MSSRIGPRVAWVLWFLCIVLVGAWIFVIWR